MTGVAWSATLVVVAMAMLVLGVYWYGQRKKKQLEEVEAGPVVHIGVDEPLELSEESVAGLCALSPEPILIKQQLDGTRVQIEHRPMVPIALFAGKDAAGALTEVASRLSLRYGLEWVAIVTAHEEGPVTVNRIK
jgi:hypothetical protein